MGRAAALAIDRFLRAPSWSEDRAKINDTAERTTLPWHAPQAHAVCGVMPVDSIDVYKLTPAPHLIENRQHRSKTVSALAGGRLGLGGRSIEKQGGAEARGFWGVGHCPALPSPAAMRRRFEIGEVGRVGQGGSSGMAPRQRGRAQAAAAAAAAALVVPGVVLLLALLTCSPSSTTTHAFQSSLPGRPLSQQERQRPWEGARRRFAEPPPPPPQPQGPASFLSNLLGGGGKQQQQQQQQQQQARKGSGGGGPPLTPQKPASPRPAPFVWPPRSSSSSSNAKPTASSSSSKPGARPPLAASAQARKGRGKGKEEEEEERADEEKGVDASPLGRARAAVAGVTARLQTPLPVWPILSES